MSALSDRYAYGQPREVNLSDEVVVITGGKGGLGGCIAEVYGMKGVRVAVLDINVGKEEEKASAEDEGDVRCYRCDVGNRAEVEKVWRRVVEDLGTPTVLVNNAAVVTGKPFLDMTAEDVERYAPFPCTGQGLMPMPVQDIPHKHSFALLPYRTLPSSDTFSS